MKGKKRTLEAFVTEQSSNTSIKLRYEKMTQRKDFFSLLIFNQLFNDIKVSEVTISY